jgi:hypothetical protein
MIGGERVKGQAAIGDVVEYFDIANQNGPAYEVISTPAENTDPAWGWSKGYGLYSVEQGITYNLLRGHGWTFKSKVSA